MSVTECQLQASTGERGVLQHCAERWPLLLSAPLTSPTGLQPPAAAPPPQPHHRLPRARRRPRGQLRPAALQQGLVSPRTPYPTQQQQQHASKACVILWYRVYTELACTWSGRRLHCWDCSHMRRLAHTNTAYATARTLIAGAAV